jgi:hypothetical protein
VSAKFSSGLGAVARGVAQVDHWPEARR